MVHVQSQPLSNYLGSKKSVLESKTMSEYS